MSQWKQTKDPSDADFYEVKVGANWLGSDEITSATFDVDQASGLVITTPGINEDTARVFISGGNIGAWPIEVTIGTASNRTLQRTITLNVAEQ
jgi:hypothetical protein